MIKVDDEKLLNPMHIVSISNIISDRISSSYWININTTDGHKYTISSNDEAEIKSKHTSIISYMVKFLNKGM